MATSDNQLYKFTQTIPTFSRSYQFALTLSLPVLPLGPYAKLDDEQYITMFCESMTLPQRTYTTTELMIQHGRPQIKIAGQVNYTPWSLQFRSEEGLSLRNVFLAWQELISTSTPKEMDYNAPSNYKTNDSTAKIKVKANGNDSDTGAVYKFYGLYPSDVSGVTLSHSDTSITTFGVEFTYDFYTVELNTANSGPENPNPPPNTA